MPDPIRPGHISFDISFKKTAPPTPVDEDAPLRIAILGHFSGRADAAGSRPLRVDCDNFDSVCAQFAASLHLPACAAGPSCDVNGPKPLCSLYWFIHCCHVLSYGVPRASNRHSCL